jgi:hypothetical protein
MLPGRLRLAVQGQRPGLPEKHQERLQGKLLGQVKLLEMVKLLEKARILERARLRGIR